MTAIEKAKQIQWILGISPDGSLGPKSKAAFDGLAQQAAAETQTNTPWRPELEGDDLWIRNVRATCFGGSGDSMDSGQTASGVSTRANPALKAVALPMRYDGPHAPTRKALGTSPIPHMPFGLKPNGEPNKDGAWVQLFQEGKPIGTYPCIDLGPDINRFPKNAIDLTLALARLINPLATANSFEAVVSYRMIGAAKYLRA